jgi:hypothetical protein
MQPNQLLTAAQVSQLAISAGYKPENLRAILDVESSGHGFSTITGRLIIRFEQSWFKREKKDWQNDTAHLAWLNPGSGNQTDQYLAFNNAFAEDPKAAMLSTSIGLPQIMGFHFDELGFKSVGEMWDFAKVSEANQVQLMIRFIKNNPKLDHAVKNGDWPTVAYYYNGAAYKELAAKTNSVPYDLRLAHSAASFSNAA